MIVKPGEVVVDGSLSGIAVLDDFEDGSGIVAISTIKASSLRACIVDCLPTI
jgi:hypothetical protein